MTTRKMRSSRKSTPTSSSNRMGTATVTAAMVAVLSSLYGYL